MTVCPGAAPIGSIVTVSGRCQHLVLLVFLGPHAYVGSGGGGYQIQVRPDAYGNFSVTFSVPSTYLSGGNVNNPLPVTPGGGYHIGSYPADNCSAPFTVAAPIGPRR
jgi:hypothetical protein